MQSIDLSVVIPVYRSGACIAELLCRLDAALKKAGLSNEIILVDDASPDNSWAVIRAEAHRYPSLNAVRLMRNGGQALATCCGLEIASGAFIATMDDDLQHAPEALPGLVEMLRESPDLDAVLAYFESKKHAGYRNVASRWLQRINAQAFGLPRDVRSSSFRVMRAATAKAIAAHQTANPAITALLFNSTRRVVSVPVPHAERFAGRSNYTLRRQFRLALDTVCNVTLLPLRIVSGLGFVLCALSMIFVLSVLWRYFTHRIGVPGWATLSTLMGFSTGLILLSLGVIGEYLVRVLREVRGYPRYRIRESIEGLVAGEQP